MRELVFVSFCLFILVLVCDACSFRISIIIQTSELRNRQCPPGLPTARATRPAGGEKARTRDQSERSKRQNRLKKLHMSHCGSLLLEPSNANTRNSGTKSTNEKAARPRKEVQRAGSRTCFRRSRMVQSEPHTIVHARDTRGFRPRESRAVRQGKVAMATARRVPLRPVRTR